MKIVHTSEPVKTNELRDFLEKSLPPLFKEQRQADIDFVFTPTGNGIQITQPDMYDDFLFQIDVANETELHVTKSEHYVNDVNLLTLENIINNLFSDYPGRVDITHTAKE